MKRFGKTAKRWKKALYDDDDVEFELTEKVTIAENTICFNLLLVSTQELSYEEPATDSKANRRKLVRPHMKDCDRRCLF